MTKSVFLRFKPFTVLAAGLILVVLAVATPQPAPMQAANGEDCLPYNPRDLRIENEGASGWLLTDGRSRMLMLDNEADAQDALALAQRHTAHCFIGRNNTRSNRSDYIVEYWTGNSGIPTQIMQPDCISYDTNNLQIVNEGAGGWLLTDGRSRMVMLDNQADAQMALELAQQHTGQCFIGRNNTRSNRKDYIVDYWMGKPNLLNDLVGEWINEDPNTDGITRAVIGTSGSAITVHMWGACTPEDCDWGETTTTTSDVFDGTLDITWNFSFKTEAQYLLMMGDKLCVIGHVQYNDDRADRDYTHCFTKAAATTTTTSGAPAQIAPPDGSVFDFYPRSTTLQWAPVSGAASYTVEIDCFHCCSSNQWCTDVGRTYSVVPGLTDTFYNFNWVGAQPGRWRVWAVDSAGTEGPKSDWWEFEYLR